jgi:adenosylhomocysteine nucleosidase
LLTFALGNPTAAVETAVIISADTEWRTIVRLCPSVRLMQSPYGEYFVAALGQHEDLLFFHGGWGKIAAAGSTQYLIDRFQPKRLINIGTCAGVEGRIDRLTIVAVEEVITYDVIEAIGDSLEAVAHYSTRLDLPAQLPSAAVRVTMHSADRDLTSAALAQLRESYDVIVADWESSAIAWVSKRNSTPVLILRGVTDLVNLQTAEAQGAPQLFQENARVVMHRLLSDLPAWISSWE